DFGKNAGTDSDVDIAIEGPNGKTPFRNLDTGKSLVDASEFYQKFWDKKVESTSYESRHLTSHYMEAINRGYVSSQTGGDQDMGEGFQVLIADIKNDIKKRHSADDFEQGTLGTYMLTKDDVGAPSAITLNHSGTWRPSVIWVRYLDAVYIFFEYLIANDDSFLKDGESRIRCRRIISFSSLSHSDQKASLHPRVYDPTDTSVGYGPGNGHDTGWTPR
ncbi:MAG: hypothetical protein AAF585_07300, partial [Verrucomicrobiota bacterium]